MAELPVNKERLEKIIIMKNIWIILFFIAFASCGQVHSEFKLQNSYQVSTKSPVCINAKNCFYFQSDDYLNYLIIHYSDVKSAHKVLLDSIEFSPYASTLHSFKSKIDSSYVVLWETKYEYFPIILAYYLKGGKVVKIGELEISLPCNGCESFEYPIKEILITQTNKEIEFSFLKDVNFWNQEINERQIFKPGTFKYQFNIETNELRPVILLPK